jgi:hypothetical protein
MVLKQTLALPLRRHAHFEKMNSRVARSKHWASFCATHILRNTHFTMRARSDHPTTVAPPVQLHGTFEGQTRPPEDREGVFINK